MKTRKEIQKEKQLDIRKNYDSASRMLKGLSGIYTSLMLGIPNSNKLITLFPFLGFQIFLFKINSYIIDEPKMHNTFIQLFWAQVFGAILVIFTFTLAIGFYIFSTP